MTSRTVKEPIPVTGAKGRRLILIKTRTFENVRTSLGLIEEHEKPPAFTVERASAKSISDNEFEVTGTGERLTRDAE